MPSYYKHREEAKKAVQPKTFEMQTDDYIEADHFLPNARSSSYASRNMLGRHAKTFSNNSDILNAQQTTEQTLLQNVIKRIEEKVQDKMAEVDEIKKYGEKVVSEEEFQTTQKNIVYRNKKKLNVISANPVERVIYKAGLGSPTLLKKKNNVEKQRLNEQRRISETGPASRISNNLAVAAAAGN